MAEYVIDARPNIDKLTAEVRHLRERVDDLEHIKVILLGDADACYSWAEEFFDALRVIADGGDREAGELAEFARGVLAGEDWSKAELAHGYTSKSARRRLAEQQTTSAVRHFLRANPDLLDILAQAKPHIDKWFPGSRVMLHVNSGDDFGDDMLVAEIQTQFDVAESMRRLDRFDDEWWLDQVAAVGGRLVIDVCYSAPARLAQSVSTDEAAVLWSIANASEATSEATTEGE